MKNAVFLLYLIKGQNIGVFFYYGMSDEEIKRTESFIRFKKQKEAKKVQHKIGYRYRIKGISYDDAIKRVFDKLGFIKTKSGVGMMWTKKTKSTYFLDNKGKIRAIYNHTNKNFWWVK